MRVTNSMMANTILLNINRNMRRVDALYRQQSSGQRINLPSENPILAGRILRFRTSVSETVQFRSNVNQGLSWMEVTQGGFLDMVAMFQDIFRVVNTGSSDPSGTWQDRQKMVAGIQGVLEQLSQTMNLTYAGRYVFAGLRTNEPPMFTAPNNRVFRIEQNFVPSDMERTVSLQSTFNIATLPAGTVGLVPAPIERGISDPDAFNPAPGTINMIRETGEFIIASDLLTGDPPELGGVLVNVRLMATAEPIINDINVIRLPYRDAQIQSPPGITIPGLAASPITPIERSLTDPNAYLPGDDEIIHIAETGELILGANVARAVTALPTGQTMGITYIKDGFGRFEPNPVIYFNSTELFHPPISGDPWIEGRTFSVDGQQLEFEFGVNTRIPVNSNARDAFTATMFAKLHAFCDFVMGLRISDPTQLRNKFESITPPLSADEIDNMIAEQINREEMLVESAVRDRFSNMLTIVQDFTSSVSFQETSLGVRINRLEMIRDRLQQDFDTYTELLSDNQDVDFIGLITELSAMRAVLQASMMTGANIMQLSLANFI